MAIAANLAPATDDRRANLKEERNRFLAFSFAAADLLIEVDDDLAITFAAGASEGLIGRDAGALIDRNFADLFVEADRGIVRAAARRLRRKPRMDPIALKLQRAADGATVPVVLSGCHLPLFKTRRHFALSVLRPALTGAPADAQSGLLARDSFEAAVQDVIANRGTLSPTAALDLLQVKGIDTIRARAGEGAIGALFTEIGDFLRTHAACGGIAGRIGPDRLAAMRDGTTEVDFAQEIEAIFRAYDPDGTSLSVEERSIALDVAQLEPADATKALTYALRKFSETDIEKLSFGSLSESFREMVSKTSERLATVRNALNEKGMRLVFQPVVALADQTVCHYEVLTRFDGNKSPFETIQFAEEVGLIEDLDLIVCQRTLKFLETASLNGTLSLAVNLSGRSIENDIFVDALEKLLQQFPKLRGRILFEITESTSIADLARANRIAQDLRRAGHKICLDDFGAGAASFPYLRAFHVDYVKIDGAYVRHMNDSERDKQILKAIVAMCQSVKTPMIAEMIEYADEVVALKRLGVQYGQGYHFGKPAELGAGSL